MYQSCVADDAECCPVTTRGFYYGILGEESECYTHHTANSLMNSAEAVVNGK